MELFTVLIILGRSALSMKKLRERALEYFGQIQQSKISLQKSLVSQHENLVTLVDSGLLDLINR